MDPNTRALSRVLTTQNSYEDSVALRWDLACPDRTRKAFQSISNIRNRHVTPKISLWKTPYPLQRSTFCRTAALNSTFTLLPDLMETFPVAPERPWRQQPRAPAPTPELTAIQLWRAAFMGGCAFARAKAAAKIATGAKGRPGFRFRTPTSKIDSGQ